MSEGKTRDPFGRMPTQMFNAGLLQRLTGTQWAAYSALCMHANSDWIAWPGIESIAGKTGYTQEAIRQALNKLVRRGLIEKVQTGGGKGRSSRYRIVTNPQRVLGVSSDRQDPNPQQALGVSKVDTPHGRRPNPQPAKGQTPNASAPNSQRALGGTEGTEQRTEQNSRPPVAAGCARPGQDAEPTADAGQSNAPDDEVNRIAANAAALADLGIGNPKRSELALMPDLTPALIRQASKGKRDGLAVHAIEQDAPSLIEKQQAQQQANAAPSRETCGYLAQQRQHAEQVRNEAEAVRQWIDSKSDPELAEQWEALLATKQPNEQQRLRERLRQRADRPERLRDSRTVRMLLYNEHKRTAQSAAMQADASLSGQSH